LLYDVSRASEFVSGGKGFEANKNFPESDEENMLILESSEAAAAYTAYFEALFE
jgi:hypothetical protein